MGETYVGGKMFLVYFSAFVVSTIICGLLDFQFGEDLLIYKKQIVIGFGVTIAILLTLLWYSDEITKALRFLAFWKK